MKIYNSHIVKFFFSIIKFFFFLVPKDGEMHTQTIHKPIRSICFRYCGTRTHQNSTPLDSGASSTAVPFRLWLQENHWSSDRTHWIILSLRGILCTNLATNRTKEFAPV